MEICVCIQTGLQFEYCLELGGWANKTSFVWAHYSPFAHAHTHTNTFVNSISPKEHEMKPSKHVWAFKCSDHRAHGHTYSRPACILMKFFLTSLSHYHYHFTNRIGVYNLLRFARKIDWKEAKRREVKRKTTLGKIVRVLLFCCACVAAADTNHCKIWLETLKAMHIRCDWANGFASKEERGKKRLSRHTLDKRTLALLMVDRLKSLTC